MHFFNPRTIMASLFLIKIFIQKAYIKDAVPAETYTKACSKLLTQYKAALRVAEVSDGELCKTLSYLGLLPRKFDFRSDSMKMVNS